MAYAKQLAADKNRTPLQEFATPFPALQRTVNTNIATSSVISLTHDTTVLEVSALGTSGVALKWIATDDTTASVVTAGSVNYDNIIPPDTLRRFVVPKETSNLQAGSAVGINRQEGLYQRVGFKGFGATSVIACEF